MTPPPQQISDLIIHRLIKQPHDGSTQIALRPAAMPITAQAQQLVDQLSLIYAERLGKGYGHFEQDESQFPLPGWLRQYAIEQTLDFQTLSAQMMRQLQLLAEQEALASGGYVLICRLHNGVSDCLLVALISEAVGCRLNGALDLCDSSYLDLANLKVAGRIDLTAWQAGAERYISFLKGRGEVAQYFKLFLACNDVVVALKETQKLVLGLGQFVEAQGLPSEQRDQLLEKAHDYLDQLGGGGEALQLDQMAQHIWPAAPQQLQGALQDEQLELANGFVPDRRAIKPLVRFKANAPQWKIEFDRRSLRSGAVIYDKHTDTLVLSNVPEHLKQALLEE